MTIIHLLSFSKGLMSVVSLSSILCLSLLVVAEERNLLPPNVDYPEIEVLGLFSNAAMLSIDGDQVFLKSGESTNQGVRVNWVNNEEVEIQFWDDVRRLQLSGKVISDFKKPERTSVSIDINDKGQYMTSGVIKNQAVRLLVDTGANLVALNGNIADDLLIDYKNAAQIFVTTTSGVVKAHRVVLDAIQVGAIRISSVEATVIPGDFPEHILLGMSFLQSVEISEKAGVMTLTNGSD